MLSIEEQNKIFHYREHIPKNHRLIVLSTNIAETSVTIPGISYVVDTGRVKQRSYSTNHTSLTSYDVMWISKASANQRAGRAGRTGPGHCYRLYSSSVYTRHFDDFTIPEILIRPIDDVVLSLKSMNVRNISSFPFPTKPDLKQIGTSLSLLCNIGCITQSGDNDGYITTLGKQVSTMPLNVRHGKILFIAHKLGVLDYAIMLVSILSESSIFLFEKEHGEDETKESIKEWKNKQWLHKYGDAFASIIALVS